MNRIAHLKVTCPQCGQYTSIYVEEGGTSAKVKCEHCNQIFVFSRGMMYEPIAYVPFIPSWAMISNEDKQKACPPVLPGNSYQNEQPAKPPMAAKAEEKPLSSNDFQQANDYDKQAVTKTRHGCLTVFLLLMILGNALIAILFALLSEDIDMSDELIVGQIIISSLTLICAILIWKWRRIGFWGIVILAGLGFILSLITGEIFEAFRNFVPVFFLWAALAKVKDGVSGWKNLE